MPKIKIHNATTNEIVEREMNDEELAQRQLDEARAKQESEAKAEALAAKAALLDRLGITADEARLLLS